MIDISPGDTVELLAIDGTKEKRVTVAHVHEHDGHRYVTYYDPCLEPGCDCDGMATTSADFIRRVMH
jgi:hypothetical protein